MKRQLVLIVGLVGSLVIPASGQDAGRYQPTVVDKAMYTFSVVRDASDCQLTVEGGGAPVTSSSIRNPAMTCPDMFSWLLFTEAVGDRWWTAWPDELQNWPPEPLPLCSVGARPPACCRPGDPNNPEGRCPTFPGDQVGLLDGTPPLRIGQPSLIDDIHAGRTDFDPDLMRLRVETIRSPATADAECTPEQIEVIIPDDYESIGRVIRQTNAEITVRNRSFHDFIFANNLYNLDGLAAVFTRNAESIPLRTPYRRISQSAESGRPAVLARIDFPANAVMIKSNWLHADLAKRLDLDEDPDHPYIKKRLATAIRIGDPAERKSCLLTGTHFLVAFHISSKDIPKWLWTTFEHVGLPGRCDITGCNDAYGFRSADELPAGARDNFVKPHQRSDGLNRPSDVFLRDRPYTPEAIRPNLAQVLDALGIGVRPSDDPIEPEPADLAWRSYRLKGSQIEYTDLEGRPTLLGNVVTEGGFMDGSSCVTCHARAGIHVPENGSPTMFELGVFSNKLTDFGYRRSAFGVPDPDWFLASRTPPRLRVLQTDFVWGFFFAQPLGSSRAAGLVPAATERSVAGGAR